MPLPRGVASAPRMTRPLGVALGVAEELDALRRTLGGSRQPSDTVTLGDALGVRGADVRGCLGALNQATLATSGTGARLGGFTWWRRLTG